MARRRRKARKARKTNRPPLGPAASVRRMVTMRRRAELQQRIKAKRKQLGKASGKTADRIGRELLKLADELEQLPRVNRRPVRGGGK